MISSPISTSKPASLEAVESASLAQSSPDEADVSPIQFFPDLCTVSPPHASMISSLITFFDEYTVSSNKTEASHVQASTDTFDAYPVQVVYCVYSI